METSAFHSIVKNLWKKVYTQIRYQLYQSCISMLAFLRDANASKSVTDIYDVLYQTLGQEIFKKLFPVILTDNGSEFSNPKAIEYGKERFKSLRIYRRKKLNHRCPYETFSFYHGEEVLHKLECAPVAAGDIMLKPALLKK